MLPPVLAVSHKYPILGCDYWNKTDSSFWGSPCFSVGLLVRVDDCLTHARIFITVILAWVSCDVSVIAVLGMAGVT